MVTRSQSQRSDSRGPEQAGPAPGGPEPGPGGVAGSPLAAAKPGAGAGAGAGAPAAKKPRPATEPTKERMVWGARREAALAAGLQVLQAEKRQAG